MSDRTASVSGPYRIGWGMGLLTLFTVVFCSTVVPGVAAWWLSGRAGAGAIALFGGFVAGWLAYLGVLRWGMRRGWWA